MFKKKILLIIFLCLFLILCLFLNKKEKVNSNTITVAEVTHSIFYAPFYVAIENGYFKEKGIEIEILLTPGADKVSSAILSKDASIGLAGAESVIYIYNADENNRPLIFAGLTQKDGQFIVSREKNENFSWDDLENQTVLTGRLTGMPALNFIESLNNYGLKTSMVNLNSSIDYASLSGAFIGGEGNYVNLFEPYATILEKEGYGYVVSSVAKYTKNVPYTVFYTLNDYFTNNKEKIANFTAALNEGIAFVNNNQSNVVASAIQNQFKDIEIADLTKMIERYKSIDVWQESTAIPEENYANLNEFLQKNNLLEEIIPYEKIVYTS